MKFVFTAMIPKDCKRLAEVDFPIAEVSASVLKREKRFPVPRRTSIHHVSVVG